MVAYDTIPSKTAQAPPPHPPINYWGLSLVFLAPALGGFNYGFDIGATSFVLSMLLNPNDEDDAWWHLPGQFSTMRQGLFVSALSLGALLGSHVLFAWLQIGRRAELRASAALYAVGTLCNVLSGTVLAHSATLGFWSVLIGRLLFGIGVGFTMHGAPAYMAEMCPPQVRGAMVSAKETIIVGGIVLGYAVGNWVLKLDDASWTDLYACSFAIAAPMIILTLYVPRSKRWLLSQGLMEEAYQSMQFVYKGDIQDAFDHLVETVLPKSSPYRKQLGSGSGDDDSESGLTRSSTRSHSEYETEKEALTPAEPSVLDPKYRSAMIASMGLIIFQQFSGQPSVLSYATVLFAAAGWSGNATVVTAVLMMMTSTCTVLLVDRLGRKRLLSACCVVMMAALAALSTTYWGQSNDGEYSFTPVQQMTLLVAMLVYIASYQIGFGPLTWCLVSETFPLEIRSKAIALGVELNYSLNFLVQFTFPILQHQLGWGRTFCMFGVILGFALMYIRVFVPETTGMTLEEIQDLLQNDSQPQVDMLVATEQTQLLGAVPTIDEMESQLIRRHSDAALSMAAAE